MHQGSMFQIDHLELFFAFVILQMISCVFSFHLQSILISYEYSVAHPSKTKMFLHVETKQEVAVIYKFEITSHSGDDSSKSFHEKLHFHMKFFTI